MVIGRIKAHLYTEMYEADTEGNAVLAFARTTSLLPPHEENVILNFGLCRRA